MRNEEFSHPLGFISLKSGTDGGGFSVPGDSGGDWMQRGGKATLGDDQGALYCHDQGPK